MLIFLGMVMVLWLGKIISLFLKDVLKYLGVTYDVTILFLNCFAKINCAERESSRCGKVLTAWLMWNVGYKIMRRSWSVWLSWLEGHPLYWKVVGLIPGQGTYPSYGFDPQWRGTYKVATNWCFLPNSLSLSLPPLSKNYEKGPWVRIKRKIKIMREKLTLWKLFSQMINKIIIQ